MGKLHFGRKRISEPDGEQAIEPAFAKNPFATTATLETPQWRVLTLAP